MRWQRFDDGVANPRTEVPAWSVAALLLVVTTLVLAQPAIAAPWDPKWQVSVGRSAEAVVTDPAGDVYVTGWVRSPDRRSRRMVIAKYSGGGAVIWRRAWQARSSLLPYSVGWRVAVSPDGDTVFVAGAELNDTGERARATIWAYTADGKLRWRRALWPASSYMATAVGAVSSGPVVGVAAWSEYPMLGDGRLAAFADDGTRLWTSPFEVAQIRRATGDAVLGVEIDQQGRVYAVGTVDRRRVTVDDWWTGVWSDTDVVIQRYDSEGRLLWSKLLTDPGVKDRDSASAVDVVGPSVVVAGLLDGSKSGGGHAWLACLSHGGRIMWSHYVGPRPSASNDVALTPWGDVQVVGTITSAPRRLFLRAYSLEGDPLSRRVLERAQGAGVAATDDPALFVVGGRSLWRLPAG